jgi:L-asparaginase
MNDGADLAAGRQHLRDDSTSHIAGRVQMRPSIAVGSLGGTVSMTSSPTTAGLLPALSAAEILASIPAAIDFAEIRAATLLRRPGASLSFDDVLTALAWADAEVAQGADGIVLLQGTDTLEEVSYLLDLLWNHEQPLVVTGAMRAPDQPGADGPANLLAAIIVAASPASRDRGVLIAMNDVVHAAARVRKSDSIAVHAFDSGSLGPLGRIAERRVVFANRTERHAPVRTPVATDVEVAIIETTLGDSGRLIEVAAATQLHGLVIAGFGAGHVPAQTLEAISAAALRMPVVLASRTGDGPVLEHTYAFAGSELDLLDRGLIGAGWLDARKARLLLWAALANAMTTSEIRVLFERHARTL